MKVSVKNMTSPNGNLVANQFVINMKDEQGNFIEVFQSYKTIIAKRLKGTIVLDVNALYYSKTTLKYLKLFLNTSKSKKDLENDVVNGFYQVENLNT